MFGLKQIFAKKSLEKEHAAEHLSSVMIVSFLLTLMFITKLNFDYGMKIWVLLYLKAMFLTFSWLFAIKALRHMEISIVVPILTMSPLFLLIIGAVFLGEVPTLLQYAGVFLLIGGAYWLQADSWKTMLKPWKSLRNKYFGYLLVPLIGYSICASLDKVVLQTMDIYTFIFSTYGVLCIHYFMIQAYKYKGIRDIKHAFKVTKWPLVLSGMFLFFSDLLYFHAVSMPDVMVSLIIPIKRMSVLLVVLVGGRMFHDHNLVHRIIGCLVMISGAVMVVL